MFRHRPALAGLALWLVLALVPGQAGAEPFIPQEDFTVLEHLPEFKDPAGRVLREQHRTLSRDPRNLALAITVAQAELDRGRVQGDPRHLGRAEAALSPWLADPVAAMPDPVLLLRAVLRQSSHDFPGARSDLMSLVARDPRNGQAWLTLAVIDGVEADYPAALLDCGQLANLSDSLAPTVCTAAIAALTGHAREALPAMRVALETFVDEPPGVRRWAWTIMAETAARLGRDLEAEASFHAALALGEPDAYLLGAYADFLLDRQRPDDVRRLLAEQTRIDPLLLRLALAESALDAPALATHVADLADRFAASRLRGESIHRREEARFTLALLHRPDEALALARANWLVQREPADARILMEAALAAGRPAAGAPALDWLAHNGVEDIRLQDLAHRLVPGSGKEAG